MPTYKEYKKMSMKELKKLAKSVGFNPVFSDGTPLDKDTLADSIHQFDVAGMFNNTTKKKAGQRVGTANYPGKKKIQPTPEELKGMKKKKSKKKESMIAEMGRRMGLRKKGGTVGTHNRLY